MSDSDSSSFSDLHSGDGDFDIKKEIHKEEDNQGWGFNLSGISLPWKICIAVVTLIVFGTAIFYLYTTFWSTPEAVIIPVDNMPSTLFPKSALEVKSFSESIITKSKHDLGTILAMSASERTYENTIFALQVIEEKFSEVMSALSLLEMLSPDDSIRTSSNKFILELHGFSLDNFGSKKVYHAVKEYLDLVPKEVLRPDEEYYLTELKDYYKRAGYSLPDDEFAKLTEIKKELAKLTLDFDTNIAEDASNISVSRADLKGCDESIIDNLHRDGENYVVGVDYPTYREVMAHCEVQATRKALYTKFNQRAYPKNRDVLVNLVNKRLQLAKILNYSTYADLDLDSEMAKNPARVAEFVNNIAEVANVKAHKDFDTLINATLPLDGVTLSAAGKLFPYDFGYVNSYYKKKNFNIDNREIAKYFPFESTVDGLFGIYQKFLNIDFKLVTPNWSWHPDVSLIEVYDKNATEQPRGFIYLDLFPRPNKYSHAAHLGVVSAVKAHKGRAATQSVAVVMCNFPKPTADGKTPSLLKHSDVVTFFHEFGHAMHHLLGETEQPSFSGTNVKTDFVEVISQMFEEWMYDEQVLQSISRHYENNQSLPSEMIQNMVRLKDFNVGIDTQSQIIYTATSLEFFKKTTDIGADDLNALSETLYTTHLDFFEYLRDEFRMVYSFGHLSGYGAKYYSYLWAKVFALDLFSEIMNRGMNDPKVGQEFVSKILAKGGSEDPMKLMKDFLGREPNQDAFFKRLR